MRERAKQKLSVFSFARRHVVVLLAVFSLAVFGCRTADVQPGKPQFDTDVKILEPAYAMRRPKDLPWYSNMQVLLDERPVDEKELAGKINDGKPEVRKNTEELLQEIENKIDEQRKGNERWSVISVQCGRGKKPNEIIFESEVGLTKLYTRRPSIVINGVPLDICITKLCRESEVQDAQPKGHNPLVSFEKKNVSAYEAIEDILKANGFNSKYTDTSFKLTFKAQDYQSRKEFVDAVTEAILAKGKILNTVKSALIVTPHVKDKSATDGSSTDAPPPADKPVAPPKAQKNDTKESKSDSKEQKKEPRAAKPAVPDDELDTVDVPVPPDPKDQPKNNH